MAISKKLSLKRSKTKRQISKLNTDEWRWSCWNSTYARLAYGGPFKTKEDALASVLAFRDKNKNANYFAIAIENRIETIDGMMKLDGKWTSWKSPKVKNAILGLCLYQRITNSLSDILCELLDPSRPPQDKPTPRFVRGQNENWISIKLNGGGGGGASCGGGGGEGGGGGGSGGGGNIYVDCWVKSTYEHTNTFGPFSESRANQCIKDYKSSHPNEDCGKRH